MWTPCFACPECGAALEGAARTRARAATAREPTNTATASGAFSPRPGPSGLPHFCSNAQTVRDRDRHRRRLPSEHYRTLPSVPSTDPQAASGWCGARRITTSCSACSRPRRSPCRCSTWAPAPAGCPIVWRRWGSASSRSTPWTMRRMDWARGGTTTCVRRRAGRLRCAAVRAEAVRPRRLQRIAALRAGRGGALARARRMLAAGGALVVMDSPMFRRDRDGAAMVDEKDRRFRHELAISDVVRPGVGYLTFARPGAIAESFELRAQFVPTRGPLPWRLRRHLARVRLRRARPRSACGWRDDRPLQPLSTTPRKQPLPLSLMSLAAVLDGDERSWTLVDGNLIRDPASTSSRGSSHRPRGAARCRHGHARYS